MKLPAKTIAPVPLAILVMLLAFCAAGRSAPVPSFVPLDPATLIAHNVKADTADYLGRKAVRLTVEPPNGSSKPALVVDGLKSSNLHGGIALWGYAGEESYGATDSSACRSMGNGQRIPPTARPAPSPCSSKAGWTTLRPVAACA